MIITIQNLSDFSFRINLEENHEPYWVIIREGLHFGYRKGRRKNTWVARHINPRTQSYFKKTIGEADFRFNVGKKISVSFDAALKIALEWGDAKKYVRTKNGEKL